MTNTLNRFHLTDKVAIITGGAGLLGHEHAAALVDAGAIPVLWDLDGDAAARAAASLGTQVRGRAVDVTDAAAIGEGLSSVLDTLGRVDILINNAAIDAKVGGDAGPAWSRVENFPLDAWNREVAVGLTGAFLCSQIVGGHMARHGGGVILNIASDLSVISPDQRLYRQSGLAPDQQPMKPVTYSVIKHGLIGLTRYLATCWAEQGVRVNAISPGGVHTGQPEAFVARLTNLIPMGRMAERDEYRAAIVFLCSDASRYMTGQNLVMDGGRSVL